MDIFNTCTSYTHWTFIICMDVDIVVLLFDMTHEVIPYLWILNKYSQTWGFLHIRILKFLYHGTTKWWSSLSNFVLDFAFVMLPRFPPNTFSSIWVVPFVHYICTLYTWHYDSQEDKSSSLANLSYRELVGLSLDLPHYIPPWISI